MTQQRHIVESVPDSHALGPESREGANKRPSIPRGVWAMSFVEMWERYSFYALQGLLTFYLIYELSDGGLGLSPMQGAGIVGGYGAAVYLSQLGGAWAGDRLISPRNLVLYGAMIIAVGHVIIALVPGLVGIGFGLVLIALGTGALKTNITTMIGILYRDRPVEERDAGFSYFYMGINLGAVLGPLTAGFAQNEWGFHYGFGLAAVVMFFSLGQYLYFMRRMPAATAVINNPLSREGKIKVSLVVLLVVFLMVLGSWFGLLRAENLATIGTTLLLVAATAYFVTMLTASGVTADERLRVWGYLPIFLGGVIYFALLFQIFTTASILVTERVDLSIGAWSFPASWVVMTGTAASIVVAPFLARSWTRLGDRQPSVASKFAIGLLVMSFGFLLLMIFSAAFRDANIPLTLVLLCMLIVGSTETLVGPAGLSLASRIGPKVFKAQMVGLNFLTLGLGSALSGVLGQLYSVMNTELFFALNAGAGVVAALALFWLRRPLKRMVNAGL